MRSLPSSLSPPWAPTSGVTAPALRGERVGRTSSNSSRVTTPLRSWSNRRNRCCTAMRLLLTRSSSLGCPRAVTCRARGGGSCCTGRRRWVASVPPELAGLPPSRGLEMRGITRSQHPRHRTRSLSEAPSSNLSSSNPSLIDQAEVSTIALSHACCQGKTSVGKYADRMRVCTGALHYQLACNCMHRAGNVVSDGAAKPGGSCRAEPGVRRAARTLTAAKPCPSELAAALMDSMKVFKWASHVASLS